MRVAAVLRISLRQCILICGIGGILLVRIAARCCGRLLVIGIQAVLIVRIQPVLPVLIGVLARPCAVRRGVHRVLIGRCLRVLTVLIRAGGLIAQGIENV